MEVTEKCLSTFVLGTPLEKKVLDFARLTFKPEDLPKLSNKELMSLAGEILALVKSNTSSAKTNGTNWDHPY